jgi:hypothetical protein
MRKYRWIRLCMGPWISGFGRKTEAFFRAIYEAPEAERLAEAARLVTTKAYPIGWYAWPEDPETKFHDRIVPVCCPFCAASLPGFRLKPRSRWPKRVNLPGDGYCGTCHERHDVCRCAEFLSLFEATD